jgi:hypothetical protein
MNQESVAIDGRLYISARRGALKSGYAADYVTQLCRTGLVPARMIGRTWYVDADALTEYKRSRSELDAAPLERGDVEGASLRQALIPAAPSPTFHNTARAFDDNTQRFADKFGASHIRARVKHDADWHPPPQVAHTTRARRASPARRIAEATGLSLALIISTASGIAALERTSPNTFAALEYSADRLADSSRELIAASATAVAPSGQLAAVSALDGPSVIHGASIFGIPLSARGRLHFRCTGARGATIAGRSRRQPAPCST